jgi:hypothetical protein
MTICSPLAACNNRRRIVPEFLQMMLYIKKKNKKEKETLGCQGNKRGQGSERDTGMCHTLVPSKGRPAARTCYGLAEPVIVPCHRMGNPGDRRTHGSLTRPGSAWICILQMERLPRM